MAAWQVRVPARGITIGDDTDVTMIPPGPTGLLGSAPVRSTDVDLAADGASGGIDRYGARLVTIPTRVRGIDSEQVNERIRRVSTAWRRGGSADVEMEVSFPGQPEEWLSYFGRCRGAQDQGWNLALHFHAMMLTFAALDPFAYGAEVVSATDSSSPLTIAAATLGDVGTVTDRATLTVVAPGGSAPVITNTTTGGVIAFASSVTGTYVLDLRDQITTKADINRDGDVAASSSWFALEGGVDNVLTFTGATSIQLTHRPAYEVI